MQDMATMQQHSITSPAPASTIQGSSTDSLASTSCDTEIHQETSRTDAESYKEIQIKEPLCADENDRNNTSKQTDSAFKEKTNELNQHNENGENNEKDTVYKYVDSRLNSSTDREGEVKSEHKAEECFSDSHSDDTEETRYACPICETAMSSQHDLTLHIRSHNNDGSSEGKLSPLTCTKAYTCKICSKVLSSSSSLDRHVLVHSGERPFKCRICGVAFTTNGNMHRHMRTHNNVKNDQSSASNYESDGSSDSGSSLNSKRSPQPSPPNSAKKRRVGPVTSPAESTYSSKPSESPPSSIQSPSSSENGHKRKASDLLTESGSYNETSGTRRIKSMAEDNSYIEATHVQNLSCPVCNRDDFSSLNILETHLEDNHPNYQMRCQVCDLVFKNRAAMNRHLYLTQHNKFEKGNKSPSKNNVQQQRTSTVFGFDDLTKWEFSSKKFPHIARIVCEQNIHRASSEIHFQCNKCERAFPCASALSIHQKNYHGSSDSGDDVIESHSDSDTPTDLSCPRKRPSASSIKSETACDSEEEIEERKRESFFAVLDLQNKSSPSSPPSSEYYQHRREDLTDDSIYLSPAGMGNGRTIDGMKDLADIQSIISVTSAGGLIQDLSKSPPQSSQCGSDMITPESGIKTSVGMVDCGAGEEEQQDCFAAEFRRMKLKGEFPCRLCTAIFPNLRALKGHNRHHLCVGVGPFRCNMCPYTNPDKSTLVRHMRTHNGDRPYECKICKYAFTTKANCERHLRNRHSKLSREDVKNSIIYHPSEDPTNDPDFSGKLQLALQSREEVKRSLVFGNHSPSIEEVGKSDQSTNYQYSLDENAKDSSALEAINEKESLDKVNTMRLHEETEQYIINNSVSSQTQTSSHSAIAVQSLKCEQRAVTNIKQVRPWETQEAATMTVVGEDEEGSQDRNINHEIENNESISSFKSLVNFAKSGNSYNKLQDQRLSVKEVGDISCRTPPSHHSLSSYSSPPRETNSPLDLTVDVLDLSTKKESTKESNDESEIPQDLSNKSAPNKNEYNNNTRYPTAIFMPKSDHFQKSTITSNNSNTTSQSVTINQHLFNRGTISPHQHSQSPSATPTTIPKLDINTAAAAGFYASPLNPLYNISNNGFPFSQSQTAFPIHPYVMYPHALFSSTNMDDIRTRLQKELINSLQLSGGTLLDPMVIASATDRLQAFHQQAYEEFTRRKGEAKFTDGKVEEGNKPVSLPAKDPEKSTIMTNIVSTSPVIKVSPAAKPSRDRDSSSVKMVIKNGVLMPKQKQRRYRTERPFACEHCSARFTLRSNMERHIKQQHPQFWTQRQRNNIGNAGPGRRSHVVPSSLKVPSPNISATQREQVGKIALQPEIDSLSVQTKSAEKTPLPTIINIPEPPKDFQISNLIHNNFNCSNDGEADAQSKIPKTKDDFANSALLAENVKTKDNSSIITNNNNINNNYNKAFISDEVKFAIAQQLKSKLSHPFIPVSGEDDDDYDDDEKGTKSRDTKKDDDEENELVIDEENEVDDAAEEKQTKEDTKDNSGGGSSGGGQRGGGGAKDVDLASVSRLLDNASTQTKAFQHYFRGTQDGEDALEGSEEDEEGLVAGSNSEGNNSGSDENRSECELGTVTTNSAGGEKKKSAYSLAPNRVACPYCFRKFPWSSSLRRHVLTHTGQKPYKCPHCPLLFTTKSNCDRHLLRKHGGQSNAPSSQGTSTGNSSSSSETSPGSNPTNYTMRNVPERPYKCNYCPSSTFSTQSNLKKHVQTKHNPLSPGSATQVPTSRSCIMSAEDCGSLSAASSQHGGEEGHGSANEDMSDDKVNFLHRPLEHDSDTVKEREKVEKSPYKLPAGTSGAENLKCTLTSSIPEPVLLATKPFPVTPLSVNSEANSVNGSGGVTSSADLPFKCHLCEGSYAERQEALNHIRDNHQSEYELLMSKGALDSATNTEDNNLSASSTGGHADDGTGAGEESLELLRGKFPDYANRKVMCAFCMRRFWSAEDLRRHMRTHTGERPFSCDICRRRFTLKHSMLRHRKKHINDSTGYNSTTNCPEDVSITSGDEDHISTGSIIHNALQQRCKKPQLSVMEEVPGASGDQDIVSATSCNAEVPSAKPVKISLKMTNHNNNNITAASAKGVNNWDGENEDFATSAAAKILSSKFSSVAIKKDDNEEETDLIGKLLGIQDRSIIDKVLQTKSADDAAKLLGVQNGGNQE